MKLGRDTYEAWLLDRMEGRLSTEQEVLLDGFLAENPDLVVSPDGPPSIRGGEIEYPFKDRLRKAYPPSGVPDAERLDDFLIARLEKDLGADQEKQLERYLYEHPGTDRQAALMALAKVPHVAVPFAGKETLERHFPPKGMPDTHRLTDFLIADLEGDLSLEQREALGRYLAEHAGTEREIRLVAATRTQAVGLHFPHKDALKKRGSRVVALWPRLAAAACFLLLIGAGWWLLRDRPTEGPEIAHIDKPADHQKVHSADLGVSPVAPAPPVAMEQENLGPRTIRSVPVGHPAGSKGTTTIKDHPPLTEPARPTGREAEPAEVPEAQSAPDELPMEEPALAQRPEEPTAVPTVPETALGATSPRTDRTAPPPAGSSQDLGTFVANTLRGKMLHTPQRKAVLDGSDALAFADKAIDAVTGGQGGVDVDRTPEGHRFQLRLGRNFSVSASTGR